MAAPTAAGDTAAPPPPPSTEAAATAVLDQKVAHPPPPITQPDAAPTAPAPAPAPRKRKLEDSGFHNSDYYKIRAVVADLRVRFVQVSQATDFRNSDAAREILKEIKVIMELSRKMRLNLGAIYGSAKPSEKPSAGYVRDDSVKPSEVPLNKPTKPSEVPLAVPAKDEPVKPSEEAPAGPVKDGATPAGENSQAPQVGQTALPPSNKSVDAPSKQDKDSSESAPVQMEE